MNANASSIIRSCMYVPFSSGTSFPSLTILSHEQLCKYPEKLPNNVSIIHGWLDQWKYNDYYQRNGIHLCTSECEGFRHYINEARASGAFVITTGAPPMDELITTRSGLLIKAASKSQFNHGFVYSTTESEIYSAVKAALALPPDERGRMIELSQSTFWKDRSRFFSRMENEFNQNLRLNSLRRSMWLKFLMGRN